MTYGSAGWPDRRGAEPRHRRATTADTLRGRLAGIEQLSYSIGPTLGTTQSGALAALTSVRTSLVAGGPLCVAGTIVLAALMPRFRRYDASVLEVPAVREDHADAGLVGRLDDVEVALGSARLDDRRDPRLDGELRTVGEREEGV